MRSTGYLYQLERLERQAFDDMCRARERGEDHRDAMNRWSIAHSRYLAACKALEAEALAVFAAVKP